jgi:hypothetical protein
VWDFGKAIIADDMIKKDILETIDSYGELKEIFNFNEIKKIVEEHYSQQKNNAEIIGYLSTFTISYKYFLVGTIDTPQIVNYFYRTLF